jgi:hypothetical protein
LGIEIRAALMRSPVRPMSRLMLGRVIAQDTGQLMRSIIGK